MVRRHWPVYVGELSADYLFPIVDIQYVDMEFAPYLARWLNDRTVLNVGMAQKGDVFHSWRIYLAAGTDHLLMNQNRRLYFSIGSVETNETFYRPSVDVFFPQCRYSVIKNWPDPVTAILLTGMGQDGHGLLALRRRGAYTIAQDEHISAVYGMPKTAVELGAAVDILSIERISRVLRETAFNNAMDRSWKKA